MKIKKKLKGMTLIEIIVALAIFTIASSVLVLSCVSIAKMNSSTVKLNKKTSYQSPIAENQNIQPDRIEEASVGVKDTIVIKYSGGANIATIEGDRYYVLGKDVVDSGGTVAGKDHDYQFFTIDPVVPSGP